MLPGPDNRTAPFIVALDSPRKRRLTFVDIDERDMRFTVSVNGKKKALSSDFVLDRRVHCGDDVEQCLKKGFSQASVIVSGGKKVVKLEWVGKGVFLIRSLVMAIACSLHVKITYPERT
jgi:hypothetical protein